MDEKTASTMTSECLRVRAASRPTSSTSSALVIPYSSSCFSFAAAAACAARKTSPSVERSLPEDSR